MSNPTPESQTRNTTKKTTEPAPAVRPPLPLATQRIEAMRTQLDAQHALGFHGRLI